MLGLPRMLLRQLFDQESATYTYLLADEAGGEAVLIDAIKENIDRDLGLVQDLGLRLVHVLDTHVHADHVTAAGLIAERTGARSVAGRLGPSCADLRLGHGDVLRFGACELKALETPGHTDDSLSYLTDGHVFTGDALLIRGCGRTDFQNGNAMQLYDSITRVLFSLPDQTLVHPAHDYRGFTVSTIGEERRLNPRIAGKSLDEFVAIMDELELPAPRRIMEAIPANRACGRPEVVG
jgi:sulfur dioxygenase